MAVSLLYGCCQIETSARRLDETRDYFQGILGAYPIEQELASQIDRVAPGTQYRCDHLGLGEAVFQINQPDPAMIFNGHPSVHQSYLDRVGPCVTNLNFFIDDYVHARQLLTAMGAPIHIEGSSATAPALGDYGPGNTRPGGGDRSFMFIGARALLGLDLELMEPNFQRFNDQTVQYPAFVQPRPAPKSDPLLFERLRIVMPDLEEVYGNVMRIFTPASRSNAYAYREGEHGRAFRIALGGIEIEYCQPTGGGGPLANELEAFGPGVVAIEFAVQSGGVANALKGKADLNAEDDWLGVGREARPGHRLSSRDPIGFDVVLTQWRHPLSGPIV